MSDAVGAPMATVEPRYQYMPAMGGWDYEQLRGSIDRNGLFREHAVVVDEDGRILDGHHRAKACAELGIECLTRQKLGLTEEQKDEYIWVVNVGRRHLTPQQKRDLMDHRLTARPEESDRSIAADLGVHHSTVGKRRAVLEASGDISQTIRPHQRTDQAEVPHHVVGTDTAQHLDVPQVELTFWYMGPSEDPDRTRKGEPYDQTQQLWPWYSGRLNIPASMPTVLPDLEPFLVKTAQQIYKELRRHPFKTMLASMYR